MYNFIFDADALIKLAHAKALQKICKHFYCLTTSEVKREAVDEGKKRLYSDAEIIEETLDNHALKIKNAKKQHTTSQKLGKGEHSVLCLSKEMKHCTVISDDQTFIQALEKEQIPFLVPVDLILLLQKYKKISRQEAKDYMENMKVFIREKDYNKVKKELEE